MTDIEKGQLSTSAAEIYDAFFVPSLFAQWTDVVLDAAGVADLIDDDGFDELSRHVEEELRDFVDRGRVAFPVTALVVGGEVRCLAGQGRERPGP